MARIAHVSELTKIVGVHDEGKVDDETLAVFLDGAEKFAERWAGRTFSPDPPLDDDDLDTNPPVTKSFNTRGRSRLIRVPDLREVTAVDLDGTALARNTTYYLDNYYEPTVVFELATRFTGTGAGQLSITGRWGPLAVDPDVKQAVLTMAARGYKRRDANFSDVLQTAAGAQLFWSQNMPEDVRQTLVNLRIPNLLFA